MTFIARGEVYGGYPMGADCDLDLLLEWRVRALEQATNLAVEFCNALMWRLCGIGLPPLDLEFLHELPAAAGLGGAGSPVPVSGLATAPGTPNETRSK